MLKTVVRKKFCEGVIAKYSELLTKNNQLSLNMLEYLRSSNIINQYLETIKTNKRIFDICNNKLMHIIMPFTSHINSKNEILIKMNLLFHGFIYQCLFVEKF